MAFNRIIELAVGSDATGLLVSDLHVDFNVERSLTFEENTAEFVIYNAKETTRKDILKTGNNLSFKVGYEDQGSEIIYFGNIKDSHTRIEGADIITTIQAVSAQSISKPLDNVYVSFSYTPGIPVSTPLKQIAAALGLILFGQENATTILTNGWTYSGSARGALKYCKEILKKDNVSLYIDNVEIVIYNIGNRTSRFSPVYLDYNSGLIRVEDITEKDNQIKKNLSEKRRIGFECLIIPKLKPNGLITVSSDSINGTFLVEKVVFSGNNYGGDFNCSGEAIE